MDLSGQASARLGLRRLIKSHRQSPGRLQSGSVMKVHALTACLFASSSPQAEKHPPLLRSHTLSPQPDPHSLTNLRRSVLAQNENCWPFLKIFWRRMRPLGGPTLNPVWLRGRMPFAALRSPAVLPAIQPSAPVQFRRSAVGSPSGVNYPPSVFGCNWPGSISAGPAREPVRPGSHPARNPPN